MGRERRLKYPDDFFRPEMLELDEKEIQRLIDSVMEDEDLLLVSSGDIMVRRSTEEGEKYGHIEVARIIARTKEMIGPP